MITILGAGGAIGGELAKLLASSNQPFRLVGRNPRGAPGAAETVAADLTDLDQTIPRSVCSGCAERGDRLLSDIAHSRRPTVLTIENVFGARANAKKLRYCIRGAASTTRSENQQ